MKPNLYEWASRRERKRRRLVAKVVYPWTWPPFVQLSLWDGKRIIETRIDLVELEITRFGWRSLVARYIREMRKKLPSA